MALFHGGQFSWSSNRMKDIWRSKLSSRDTSKFPNKYQKLVRQSVIISQTASKKIICTSAPVWIVLLQQWHFHRSWMSLKNHGTLGKIRQCDDRNATYSLTFWKETTTITRIESSKMWSCQFLSFAMPMTLAQFKTISYMCKFCR